MDYLRFPVKLTLSELGELSDRNETIEQKYHEALTEYENKIIDGIVRNIDNDTFDLLSEYLNNASDNNADLTDFYDNLRDAVYHKGRL